MLANPLFRFLLPLMIVLGAGGLAWWLVQSPVQSQKTPQVQESEQIPLVRAKTFYAKQWRLPLELDGVVRASQDISLFAEVAGRVVEVHPVLADGGLIQQGEVVLKLSAPGLAAQLSAAASGLRQAKQRLAQVQAQVGVAGEVPGLKTPQGYRDSLVQVQTLAVQAARAEVAALQEQAARQTVRAPFDGRFKGPAFTLGQAVPVGGEIGQFYGAQDMLVDIPMNPKNLDLIRSSPDTSKELQIVIAQLASDQPQYLEGTLGSKQGALDPLTGLTRLSVQVGTAPTTVEGIADRQNTALVPGERVAVRIMFRSPRPTFRLPLGFVKGNDALGVRLAQGDQGLYRGEVVRHQLQRVMTDRRYAYFERQGRKNQGQSVLHLVPRPKTWLVPGHKVSVRLQEQGA